MILQNKKLTFYSIIGNIIIGIGVATIHLAGFGIDPFTSMTMGTSHLLGVGLGLFQMCINILIYIPVLLMNKKAFGIGACFNLLCIGYIVEYVGKFYQMIGLDSLLSHVIIRFMILLIGVIVVCFGCALYMDCKSGIAPYDAIAPLIEEKTDGKIKFKYARIMTDVLVATIGLVTGFLGNITTIGIATLIVAAGTGPIVSFFRQRVVSKMIA